ncbi:outer membrane protein assembly factor BamD [Haliangium sp.]|uniref:outer membrane protein assembly factor BamD n=1 Tax=Haliangium sp. TaxID=2663208 RepID=UPI003D15041C
MVFALRTVLMQIPPRLLAVALAALAVTATAGCGSKGPMGTAKYSVSAQQNYRKGMAEMKEKDWIAAVKYFAFIKSRFPYSKYAVLAELRMADAEFGAGNYLQAIDAYKLFIKFHPTHRMATSGYAAFRIGESYTKMLPGDMWILPPSYEKDQSVSYDAERELRTFVEKYPDSPYRKKAQELLAKVHKHLAAHEWYVAKYYWDQGKPMGTVLRLRRLIDRYGGTSYDGEALWLLGQAYVEVDMPDRARDTWQTLIDQHPDHARAQEARRALARLAG